MSPAVSDCCWHALQPLFQLANFKETGGDFKGSVCDVRESDGGSATGSGGEFKVPVGVFKGTSDDLMAYRPTFVAELKAPSADTRTPLNSMI